MRQNLKSIGCEISPGIFVLNNLKGTVKALAVGYFEDHPNREPKPLFNP